MTDHTNIFTLAAAAAQHFTRRDRANGVQYWTVDFDAPEWVADMVREAHGDLLPDDRIFALCVDALTTLSDADRSSTDAQLDDLGGTWADEQVDPYLLGRMAWLSSHPERVDLADDAAFDLDMPQATISERAALGQYEEARGVWGALLQGLRAEWSAANEEA